MGAGLAMGETLEMRAMREGLIYVPVSREIAEQLEREEDGPVFIKLEVDLSGHELLRNMVVRTQA